MDLAREKRRAISRKRLLSVLCMILTISLSGRDRLAVCRTTDCREQPISAQGWLERVLETASRSLPLARPQQRTNILGQFVFGAL
jgi:hypothetical protein